MALMHLNFERRYLGGNTPVNIILPNMPNGENPAAFYASGKKYPVLWLLHGGMGDGTDWIRKSNIETYACENDLIVVMPYASNSSYANWTCFGRGFYMYDFLIDELMPLVYNWLPASGRREDNFIAGMSMGGVGTLKYVLNNPERFAAAAAISCSARKYPDYYVESLARNPERERMYINLVNNNGGIDAFMESKENIRRTIEQIVSGGRKEDIPPIYAAIGTSDSHYADYADFRTFCTESGFDRIEFHETPGYAHEWRYWEETIQDALAFFGFQVRKGPAVPANE